MDRRHDLAKLTVQRGEPPAFAENPTGVGGAPWHRRCERFAIGMWNRTAWQEWLET
jgi:hypothetical protein